MSDADITRAKEIIENISNPDAQKGGKTGRGRSAADVDL